MQHLTSNIQHEPFNVPMLNVPMLNMQIQLATSNIQFNLPHEICSIHAKRTC